MVIPVFYEQCRVTEMYGRKINENLREGTPRHLYLPGPHRGVWDESRWPSRRKSLFGSR